VLSPAAIEFAISEFGRQLRTQLDTLSSGLADMRRQKAKLEAVIDNLMDSLDEASDSAARKPVLQRIAQKQSELDAITDRVLSAGGESIEAGLDEIRRFVSEDVGSMKELLNYDVEQARAVLTRHVTEVRMEPDPAGKHYVADGGYNLLGGYDGKIRVPVLASPRNTPESSSAYIFYANQFFAESHLRDQWAIFAACARAA